MSIYYLIKQIFLKRILVIKKSLVKYNLSMNMRRDIKKTLKKSKLQGLTKLQKRKIKLYFKRKGYSNIKLYWHHFYTSRSNTFCVEYIPEDIFHPIISPMINQMKQWPALLDKNLSETIFNGFKQPDNLVKNINGFFYVDNKQIERIEAIDIINKFKQQLIIKPSIESGSGRMINVFAINNFKTSFKGMSINSLLDYYNKDYIIQKIVEQSTDMKSLNPTSLNTLRIMSYMRETEIHILSSIVRIGGAGSHTDNYSTGGVVCGIKDDGNLREYGYPYFGERVKKTESGVVLGTFIVPNFNKAISMVKEMHFKIPYFRIISWDIGLDITNTPIFIEYNTYRQGIGVHQITNGPLFGEFTDELLEIGRKYKP